MSFERIILTRRYTPDSKPCMLECKPEIKIFNPENQTLNQIIFILNSDWTF